ncbi:MAG: UDP-N-acetylmuramate dehydrogenase [Burkholderiales bacterium]|nr:UDP-N-acetylmuramate dehydrogenase [Burkholderiales bacterium]
MEILKNYDLTKLNTFGVKAFAKFFFELKEEKDLGGLFLSSEFKNNEKLFLGSGSNILFTKDFDGIVILNSLKGISILKEDEDFVYIRALGGEKWHDLVLFSVDNGYWGMENLSLIPGTVGATPVQNIGAYGVEIKDVLENIEAYSIEDGQKKVFSNKECEFGYRESAFKNKLKGKYFISAVVFKLHKKEKKNSDYKALQDYLKENNLEIKTSKDVSDAIIEIRRSKLPNPFVLGNAGSFFKNVYVNEEKLKELLNIFPEMPYFTEPSFTKVSEGKGGMIKIPAGFLIEMCGWKGKKVGNVGVHDKQALVIVNYGGATGEEIKKLSEDIISSVYSKFGLKLEREVNLI